MWLKPSPATCGKMNHIQWPRLRPPSISRSACSNTPCCAVTKRWRSCGSVMRVGLHLETRRPAMIRAAACVVLDRNRVERAAYMLCAAVWRWPDRAPGPDSWRERGLLGQTEQPGRMNRQELLAGAGGNQCQPDGHHQCGSRVHHRSNSQGQANGKLLPHPRHVQGRDRFTPR